jgi:hypothetical protein
MRHSARLTVLAGTLAVAACGDLAIPDYQNPPLDDLLTNPTVETVKAAATGVLQGTRQDHDTYVKWTGILGREGYYLDSNESRYVRLLFNGTPAATNFTGSSYWTTPFRNVRTAQLLVLALDHPNITMTAQEEEAIRGFAKTIQALDLFQVLQTREKIPVDLPELDQLTTPAPIVERAAAFQRIVDLLNQGRTHLLAGGASFPFPLPSGFTQFGFDTPAEWVQFNRALLARVEVMRATIANTGEVDVARYEAALDALAGSFIDLAPVANPLDDRSVLNKGVYQTYSGSAGDVANTLYDPSGKTVADSTLRRDVQLMPGGDPDARFQVKTVDAVARFTVNGLSSDLRFTIYDNRPFFGAGGQASPIPIIRNEELVLLRAEARWFTGDQAGATADLNWVRVNSGGLAPIAQPATDADFVTALLREIRYSLMYEGGHRWTAYRRFGRLAQLGTSAHAQLRNPVVASDKSATWLPLPSNETLPRQ